MKDTIKRCFDVADFIHTSTTPTFTYDHTLNVRPSTSAYKVNYESRSRKYLITAGLICSRVVRNFCSRLLKDMLAGTVQDLKCKVTLTRRTYMVRILVLICTC